MRDMSSWRVSPPHGIIPLLAHSPAPDTLAAGSEPVVLLVNFFLLHINASPCPQQKECEGTAVPSDHLHCMLQPF